MNKLQIIILLSTLFFCLSCKKEKPQTQMEQTALNFCEAFYNFNYPVAMKWSTPSSLSYLSYLASNIQQAHLDQLKTKGSAESSIIKCEMDSDLEKATVVCLIKNALIINPIRGNTEHITSLQDTLHLINKDGKWLVRKDIPLQNEKRSHD